ncbi:TRAPP subunit trs31 [Rhizophlyctis rosea]|uniref:Trafficking protein particle complex subunit n=1 Tax=Rhizophlyctis rosea TaxID=64517 RepID=A0AAD5S7W1_9FUNG|nr:TRAPP subunit trs31 [Rhizophlyctis rosea]
MSQSQARSTPSARKANILDRNLNKTKNTEVSLSAFSFLFSEMFQYAQKRANGIQDLEKRLSDFGYRVGIRMLELTVFRERNSRRDTRVLNVLSFIHSTIWKSLFGKPADSLEKGTENDDEYMISDNEPNISKFISVPKELSQLSAGAFTAGIVEAILDGSQFPARVTAHATGNDQFPVRTTLLIKFDKSGK